ncbi:hypothetical protein ILYODFUR_017734 [Ilyodon furcidens]|uniref:Uncharacterized protein n=1 Tax=Ilyodon furcidens TaxID=33524 RepID=A0ABV0SMX7_9TELE
MTKINYIDLSLSVPCPPSNASISTNELIQSSPSSPKKHLRNRTNCATTTWIPNPSTPGDLTAPTYWSFARFRS